MNVTIRLYSIGKEHDWHAEAHLNSPICLTKAEREKLKQVALLTKEIVQELNKDTPE